MPSRARNRIIWAMWHGRIVLNTKGIPLKIGDVVLGMNTRKPYTLRLLKNGNMGVQRNENGKYTARGVAREGLLQIDSQEKEKRLKEYNKIIMEGK